MLRAWSKGLLSSQVVNRELTFRHIGHEAVIYIAHTARGCGRKVGHEDKMVASELRHLPIESFLPDSDMFT